MKHTKGKWDISVELTQGTTNGTRRIKCDFDEICLVNPNMKEHEANAKLISKAPEMYEALNHAKRVLDVIKDKSGIAVKVLSKDVDKLLKEIEK